MSHTVEHTDGIFVIDRVGNSRLVYRSDVEPSVLSADVRELLRTS